MSRSPKRGKPIRPKITTPRATRPALECLEDRTLPSGATLYVDPSGVTPSGQAAYTTIQAAVNAAPAGSTVVVDPGTYTENVTVAQQGITLDGAKATVGPLVGRWGPESVLNGTVTITGPGVTVDGFTVNAASQWAIEVGGTGSQNCAILNNIVTSTVYGIQIGDEGGPSTPQVTLNALVKENIVHSGNSNIALFNSAGSTVRDNFLPMTPSQFGSGIDIYYSDNNSILSNVVNSSPTPTSPWYFSAIKLRGAHGNDVENNFGMWNGRPPVFETEGASGNTILNNFQTDVPPASTTTTLGSDQPGGSLYGQPVTLTASVSAGPGAGTGGQFRVAFVSTNRIGPFSSDISYYDGIVSADAISAGLGTFNGQTVTWQAIASTATTSANSRLLPDSVPIYLPDGTVVATGVSSAFWSGTALVNPINETLTGWKPYTDVWTGTSLDGSASSHPLGTEDPAIGTSSATAGPVNWLSWTFSPAGDAFPLYGISSVLTAPQAAGVPTGSVDFFDTTANTDLGTVSLSGGSAVLVTSSLGVGTHVITATYGGDGHFLGGAGSTTVHVIPPASLSGTVFADFNDDGQIDFGENGISNVAITLSGTDDLGHPVSQSLLTDADGAYVFGNLRPGSYTLSETQPAGYTQGINTVGTAGGTVVGDQFSVTLAAGVNGLNYNYGDRPAATGPVQKGQTAGIGFWNNKNGQALILALNGGATSTQLGDWLAATLPNMFGANSANDLAGQTNAYIAALFQSDFVVKGVKLDAQVLATALAVYATSATLDPTQVAANYGFVVSGDGVGAATWNVGTAGDAFGVANDTTMTVMDLLLATDDQAVDGLLYNGNATKRNEANAVYSALNQAGSIS